MPSLHEILFAFLLAPCVCGTILLVAARSTSATERGWRWNAVAGTWAFGLGYLIAHLEIAGVPAWPSAARTPTALDWLGWMIVFALPLSGLYLTHLGEQSIAWIVRVLCSSALVLLSLRGWMQGGGSPFLAAVFAAILILISAITDALVARSPGPIPVLPLFVAMTGASVSSLLGHSALVAELAGATCTLLGASAVVAIIAPRFQLSAGAVAVFLLVFAGVLLNGVFFSDVHWSSAIFSILALIAPWLAVFSRRTARGPWRSAAIRSLIAAAFSIAAVIAAHLNAPSYEY